MYFNGQTLHIFTLVTGPYKAFFNNFYQSLSNFFPGNPKVIHIASDGLDELDEETAFIGDIIDVDLKHIIDLPYPMVPMQKTYMQTNYVTDDMKYVFYFDIDTVFKSTSDETWKFLESKVEEGNIIMSKHPHYDAHPEWVWNLIEMNQDSKAYIPEEYYEHCISSFWGGKAEEVLKMDKYVNAMTKYDLKNVRYLPKFVDENYINKIIWQTKKGEITDIKFFNQEHLIDIPGYVYNVETPYIFLLQKYDNSIKNSKKNVQ